MSASVAPSIAPPSAPPSGPESSAASASAAADEASCGTLSRNGLGSSSVVSAGESMRENRPSAANGLLRVSWVQPASAATATSPAIDTHRGRPPRRATGADGASGRGAIRRRGRRSMPHSKTLPARASRSRGIPTAHRRRGIRDERLGRLRAAGEPREPRPAGRLRTSRDRSGDDRSGWEGRRTDRPAGGGLIPPRREPARGLRPIAELSSIRSPSLQNRPVAESPRVCADRRYADTTAHQESHPIVMGWLRKTV